MFKSKALRCEETGLDAGLQECQKLKDDLGDCLNIVERLSRKNSDPDEGRLSVDCLGSVSTIETSSCPDLSSSSLLLQDSEGNQMNTPAEARSGQKLRSSYVDIRTKCIKLKRELEGTVSLAKHISGLAHRQRNRDYSIPEEKPPTTWRI
ncbi:GL26139 [Drosophila persimilis]|uniref:GL26139 n=1 Tax=Drosophila persimilis TaxID=7234 RepID=B4GUK4_DROPE|nr:uncharacterized protein LOC6597092 [Drosophila persimilis]EDW26287.1 GL26139 [Drosophila persimilis]